MICKPVLELGNGSGELHSVRLPELATRHLDCGMSSRSIVRGKQAGNKRLESLSATIQMDDAVNIQFTSGTDCSKGATLRITT
jgi:fatty-acyl-CoA synthase